MTARGDSSENSQATPEVRKDGLDLLSLTQEGQDGTDALAKNEAALAEATKAIADLYNRLTGSKLGGSVAEVSAAVNKHLYDHDAYKRLKENA